MPTTRESLEAEWTEFLVKKNSQGKNTLAENWRNSNPGEWSKLQTYRSGGVRPSLVTSLGKQMVEHVTAYLSTAPVPPPPPPPPPPPTGTFGSALYPRLVASPGSEIQVSTLSQLTSAIANAAPGSRIRNTGTIDIGGGDLTISRSGTSVAPFTLTGGKFTNGRIVLNGSGYWWLKDFETQGAYWDGIKTQSGAHHFEIDSLHIHGKVNQGILVQQGDDFNIYDCHIHDIGFGSQEGPNQLHCIYLNSSKRFVVANNKLEDASAYGFQTNPGYTWATIEDGFIVCNSLKGGPRSIRGGIAVDNANRMARVKYVGNIVEDADETVTVYGTPTSTTMYDTLWWQTNSFEGTMNYEHCLTLDPATNAKGFIQSTRYQYVPPYDRLGNVRITADAGCEVR
jgi:hypothetical protein